MLTEFKYRITYQITGLLRFLSHKELMRMISRVFRRARLPLAFSHGFHPHPLIAFGPPRPVGVAGTSEQIDFRLVEFLQPAVLSERISSELPRNVRLTNVAPISLQTKSITASIEQAEYELNLPGNTEHLQEKIEDFISKEEVIFQRKTPKGLREINIRNGVFKLNFSPPLLKMRLALAADNYVRPTDVLSKITGWPDDEIKRVKVTRTGFLFTTETPDNPL